ncbi:MAG: hypothetical protein J6S43_03425 [Lentisphaeria bacterium]|nr:hypothetical protein [Lentisphaeria bacterium]
MAISPGMIQLAAMLDDRDEELALNVLARMLANEEELGELPGILQESPDPLIRRRAHMLQNALSMRRQRREVYRMLHPPANESVDIFETLAALHLLWFDKDQAEDIRRDIDVFLQKAGEFPLETLTDGEMFMRRCCFLPENETTIRPESYCIGTVLSQRCGAGSVLMTMLLGLLGKEKYRIVRALGQFGIADNSGNLLLGNGNWRMVKHPGGEVEEWSVPVMMRYICTTLHSCAVNSDSYRYVMSITQALTGDESEHVFDDFPYPFLSNPDELNKGGNCKSQAKRDR